MKKCPICENGNLIRVKNIKLDLGGYDFILKGERCDNCKEEFLYEDEAQKALTLERSKSNALITLNKMVKKNKLSEKEIDEFALKLGRKI